MSRKVELFIIFVLIVLAVGMLFGVYERSKVDPLFDLLAKFAFAILVTVVARIVTMVLSLIDKQNEEKEAYSSFLNLGMKTIHPTLDDEEIHNRLAQSKKIKVLKTWFPENRRIEEGLQKAIKNNGASVKLLLLKPDSMILRERSTGAGEHENHGHNKVINTLSRIKEWICESGENKFEIGLYNSWPACPVIWYDENILMGFYFRGHSSTQWPWVEVTLGSPLEKILNDQFNSLWNRSETIKISNCDQLEEEIKKWVSRT